MRRTWVSSILAESREREAKSPQNLRSQEMNLTRTTLARLSHDSRTTLARLAGCRQGASERKGDEALRGAGSIPLAHCNIFISHSADRISRELMLHRQRVYLESSVYAEHAPTFIIIACEL